MGEPVIFSLELYVGEEGTGWTLDQVLQAWRPGQQGERKLTKERLEAIELLKGANVPIAVSSYVPHTKIWSPNEIAELVKQAGLLVLGEERPSLPKMAFSEEFRPSEDFVPYTGNETEWNKMLTERKSSQPFKAFAVMPIIYFRRGLVTGGVRELLPDERDVAVFHPTYKVLSCDSRLYQSFFKVLTALLPHWAATDPGKEIQAISTMRHIAHVTRHSYLGAVSPHGQLMRLKKGNAIHQEALDTLERLHGRGLLWGTHTNYLTYFDLMEKVKPLRKPGSIGEGTCHGEGQTLVNLQVRQVCPRFLSPNMEWLIGQYNTPAAYDAKGNMVYVHTTQKEVVVQKPNGELEVRTVLTPAPYHDGPTGPVKLALVAEIQAMQMKRIRALKEPDLIIASLADESTWSWRRKHFAILNGWRFTKFVTSKFHPASSSGLWYHDVMQGVIQISLIAMTTVFISKCIQPDVVLNPAGPLHAAFYSEIKPKVDVYEDKQGRAELSTSEKVRNVFPSNPPCQFGAQALQKPILSHLKLFANYPVPHEHAISLMGQSFVGGHFDALIHRLLEEPYVVLFAMDNLFLKYHTWVSLDTVSMEATHTRENARMLAMRILKTYADVSVDEDELKPDETTWAMEAEESFEPSMTPGLAPVNPGHRRIIGKAWANYLVEVWPNISVDTIGVIGRSCIPVGGMASGVQGTGYMNDEANASVAEHFRSGKFPADKLGLSKFELKAPEEAAPEDAGILYKWYSPLLGIQPEGLAYLVERFGQRLKVEAATGKLVHGITFAKQLDMIQTGERIRMDLLGWDCTVIDSFGFRCYVPVLAFERLFKSLMFDKFRPPMTRKGQEPHISATERRKLQVYKYLKLKTLYFLGCWTEPLLANGIAQLLAGMRESFKGYQREELDVPTPALDELVGEEVVEEHIIGAGVDENLLAALVRKRTLPNIGDVIRLMCGPIYYQAYLAFCTNKFPKSPGKFVPREVERFVDPGDLIAFWLSIGDQRHEPLRTEFPSARTFTTEPPTEIQDVGPTTHTEPVPGYVEEFEGREPVERLPFVSTEVEPRFIGVPPSSVAALRADLKFSLESHGELWFESIDMVGIEHEAITYFTNRIMLFVSEPSDDQIIRSKDKYYSAPEQFTKMEVTSDEPHGQKRTVWIVFPAALNLVPLYYKEGDRYFMKWRSKKALQADDFQSIQPSVEQFFRPIVKRVMLSRIINSWENNPKWTAKTNDEREAVALDTLKRLYAPPYIMKTLSRVLFRGMRVFKSEIEGSGWTPFRAAQQRNPLEKQITERLQVERAEAKLARTKKVLEGAPAPPAAQVKKRMRQLARVSKERLQGRGGLPDE